MQFNLPSNLQNAVAAYDPEKKMQRRIAAASTNGPKKKSGYPLGNPFDLIPPEIVDPADLQRVIGTINASNASKRYHSFCKIKVSKDNPFQSTEDVYAFIFHVECLWLAVWLPPENQRTEYLFGYARAFKNNEKSRNMVPSHVRDKVLECGEIVTYGKSSMAVERKLVTIEDMQAGYSSSVRWPGYSAPWNYEFVGYGHKKTYDMRIVIDKFEKTLTRIVPSWEGCKWYERLLCRNPLEAVGINVSSDLYQFLDLPATGTELSTDILIKIIDFCKQKDEKCTSISEDTFKELDDIRAIISTPLIKKWIQNKLDKINSDFNDPSCVSKSGITCNWSHLEKCLDNLKYVKSIWHDCPLDYYSSNIDALSRVYIRQIGRNLETKAWLAKHMPVASFFQILKKYLESEQGIHTSSFHEWNDTVSMLNVILTHADYKQDLETPKRWRISEFHDYVQSEAWKLRNEKLALPQDLFPSPIKVETGDGRIWSFFQPIDTHQLAQWGQAVRNCVGNASHYAEEIKKKKHLIVLCNLNRVPTFTIQLKVNDGIMSVVQVVSTSNRRLTEAESADYGKAFQMALLQREAQLNSGQPEPTDDGAS
jgi:hypothetical protein